jgi:hypothetical protein
MDVNKLSPGQRIAAAAGVLLFIDLFLDWYSAGNSTFSISADAWQVFSWVDLVLAVTCVLAVGVAAQAMGLLKLPVNLAQLLLPVAAVATVLVLYRLLNQPGPNDLISNEFGAYLGLVLSAAVTYGAFRAQGEPAAVVPTTTSSPPPPPPPAV